MKLIHDPRHTVTYIHLKEKTGIPGTDTFVSLVTVHRVHWVHRVRWVEKPVTSQESKTMKEKEVVKWFSRRIGRAESCRLITESLCCVALHVRRCCSGTGWFLTAKKQKPACPSFLTLRMVYVL